MESKIHEFFIAKKRVISKAELSFVFLFCITGLFPNFVSSQTITDIDGNVYNTITIGTQVWTKENLKVTHYRNGDQIPNVTDIVQWCSLTSGAYCSYDNDSANAAVYGMLYNWYAVNDSRSLAPAGWHVPTYSDLDSLQIYLGYDLVAGGKLKEVGTSHWMSPNTGASNESEFTALPGGQRTDSFYSCMFSEITTQGYWWSSTEMDTTYPWGINISYNSEGMTNWAASKKQAGFSIRLIKDLSVGIHNIDEYEYFDIYPNPARDRIVIAGANNMEMTIAIYSLLGELLMKQNLENSKNVIDISALSTGMYMIKLTGNGWSVQRKLNKE